MRAPRVFVLDNYDSFTFNLVQYLGALGADVRVERNDRVTVEQIEEQRPDGVVVSPGPGAPEDAGISVGLIGWCARSSTHMLGVCLGHQALGQAFGAKVLPAASVMHGKASLVHHDGSGVLRGLPDPIEAMRYHSLVVGRDDLPHELLTTAWTQDGTIMGLRHRDLPLEGVQFHPESVLTPTGLELLRNFLDAIGAGVGKEGITRPR